MNKIFFTSDSHFFDKDIIRHENRPFDSVEEMNESLIKRWNDKVGKGDVVFHLGDFAVTGYSKTRFLKPVSELIRRLNGNIHLLRGNHDSPAVTSCEGFVKVHNLLHKKINGQRIIMCHYPIRSWQFKKHGSWMLYGHSHGRLPPEESDLSLDVGVDIWDYTPISFEEIKAIFEKKQKIIQQIRNEKQKKT